MFIGIDISKGRCLASKRNPLKGIVGVTVIKLTRTVFPLKHKKNYNYPPVSKASREVATLTERKRSPCMSWSDKTVYEDCLSCMYPNF